MRRCRYCETEKPLDQFRLREAGKPWRVYICNECAKAYQKEYRRRPEAKAKLSLRVKTPAAKEAQRKRQRQPDAKRRAFAKRIFTEFGLTMEDLARMYEAQDRKCPGCQRPLLLDSRTMIDHDHSTGRVRGLLCHWCNLALGLLGDDLQRLRRLISYLAQPREVPNVVRVAT